MLSRIDFCYSLQVPINTHFTVCRRFNAYTVHTQGLIKQPRHLFKVTLCTTEDKWYVKS